MKKANYFPFIIIATLIYLFFFSSQRDTFSVEKKIFQSGKQSIEVRFVKLVKKTNLIKTSHPLEKPLKEYKSKATSKMLLDKKVASKSPTQTKSIKQPEVPDPFSPPPSVKENGVLQEAIVQNGSKPIYPKLAILRGKEGVVVVKLTVTAQGTGINTNILSTSGASLLDNSILNFIEGELFLPDNKEGKAIDSEKIFSFKFELN